MNPADVYTKLIDLMEQLAKMGLVHCDFNEFNVLVCGEGGQGRRMSLLDTHPLYSCPGTPNPHPFTTMRFQISENEDITLIDFPQMVSTNHWNAEVSCEEGGFVAGLSWVHSWLACQVSMGASVIKRSTAVLGMSKCRVTPTPPLGPIPNRNCLRGTWTV